VALLASRQRLDCAQIVADFPEELVRILRDSFAIRTTLTRKTGQKRTIETTYCWDGAREIVLSGFPGKRDWVASLARNPDVVIHTVELGPAWDIAGRARVLREREERLPYLMRFIERWMSRPGFPRRRFGIALGAVKLNRRLGLGWWGPFRLARRIFDGMPCVVITLAGAPRRRPGPPPEPDAPRPPG
jgi:hypothetical protein